MKIRSLLMIVVLCTLLPVLFLAIFLSIVFHHQQRSAFELRYFERARAFGLAPDRALDAQIHALQILAESDALQGGDLKRFYERTARTRAVQTNWANITLNDLEREVQLINLRVPFGTPPGKLQWIENFEPRRQNRKAIYSAPARGPREQQICDRDCRPR